MNKNEIIKTLISKYGVIETLRFYLRGVHESATSIKIGMAENNQMLAAKNLELMLDNLQYVEMIIQDKDNRKALLPLENTLE